MMIFDCSRVAPGDDRVELLDELLVGVELLASVGALGDEDVDVLDDRRVGQQARVAAAEVAREEEPAVLAVLLVVDLDHRRAEDVAGVLVRQRDARQDLGRRLVVQAVEVVDDPFDVVQLEEGFERAVVALDVPQVLALDAGRVAEHDVEDVARGPGGVDRPGIAGAGEAGQAADVVVVRVRDDDRVERAGVEGEVAVGALGAHAIGVEQAAVEQDSVRADLQQVCAAGDLPGGPMKRDAQAIVLPPRDDHAAEAGGFELALDRGCLRRESGISRSMMPLCPENPVTSRADAPVGRSGRGA